MVKWTFSAVGFCGLLVLGGCNVGSDESQQPNTSTSSQAITATSVQGQLLKTAVSPTTTATTVTHTETYYLVLHGVTTAGERIGSSIMFQKNVSSSDSPSVQLIWFEPNRKADGSCLQDLGGYDLEYGLDPSSYNTTLTFDLTSRDMSCTTVGSTECGDVRECRYNLTL